jgi:hypothetical protein
VDPDADTDPTSAALPVTPRALDAWMIAFEQVPPRHHARARHANPRRLDAELLALAVALFGCAGLSAAAWRWGGLTPYAAGAWAVGGVTALLLAAVPARRTGPVGLQGPPPPPAGGPEQDLVAWLHAAVETLDPARPASVAPPEPQWGPTVAGRPHPTDPVYWLDLG